MAATHTPKKGAGRTPKSFYNYIGFQKRYNFTLWFIFAGAMFGFVLARFMYLDFDGQYCPSEARSNGSGAAPGECYYYRNFSRYKIGILMHLGGILPASLLAILQFTPFIRYRWILVHRISGYLAITLYLISLVGVLMIARHALGGSIDVQTWVGFVGFGVLACFVLSWINIRKLQIEQHRAWMLRGWFYAGSIITARFIMIIAAVVTSDKGYYAVWTCAKILSTYSDKSLILLVEDYPACSAYVDGSNPDQVAPVAASFAGSSSAGVGAALNLSFGAALWLAFNLHAMGVEIYLHLTPREAERLRKISHARQLEAGMRNPGSAGLTADRLGDSDRWTLPPNRASNCSVGETPSVDAGGSDQLHSRI